MPTLETHGRLASIKALAKVTDNVVVSFSGGKDSLAVLSLCKRFIPKVSAVFFYKIPNLTFEQSYIARISALLGVEIKQFPATSLLTMLDLGVYGADTVAGTDALSELPTMSWWHGKSRPSKMINALMLRATGASWSAVGIKKYDTLVRYTTIYKQFHFMNEKDKIAYPVIDWLDTEVWNYLRLNRLPVSPLYTRTGRSFSLVPASLKAVREMFPEDYKKVLALYPHIETAIVRGDQIEGIKASRRRSLAEIRAARRAEASKVHDGAAEPEGHQEGPVQPTGHLASRQEGA